MKTILLISMFILSSFCYGQSYHSRYRPSYSYENINPNNVRIESRLVGRLDWAWDSYYEIDLFIDGQKVASTTEYANLASEKISYLRNTIKQAKEEQLLLDVSVPAFDQNAYESIKLSDEHFEVAPVRTECERRSIFGGLNEENESFFSKFLSRAKVSE